MAISTADTVARRSVEVLKQGQAESGALIASPAFPVCRYAWLRDGAFCAHALDIVGETEAASAFHAWVVRSIESHRAMIERAIERIDARDTPRPEEMPPARYTLDGSLEQPDDEPWPNFQVDGYGMWLWALSEHLRGLPAAGGLRDTIELVARYVESTWPLKSFSCWEEFDGGEHASTLGTAVAGLEAASRLLDERNWMERADDVREHLLGRFLQSGRFMRGPADERVDGSLLWLAVPFQVLPVHDPRIEATVEAVRRDLHRPGGGVYRYRGDSYYGGGEWILLACSLAWHELQRGDRDAAEPLREWVRAQAQPNGDLPEQVSGHLQQPEMYAPWFERWGPVATPLLWSHAMYLIMESAAGA